MFFALENLGRLTLKECPEPWAFKAVQEIPLQVRKDKQSRQEFYQTETTSHNFYTPIEPENPNTRCSKENPPRALHGIVADFDMPISKERVAEAIASMKIKPAWVERSLGGNVRLVWTFARPIPVEGADFATAVLEASAKWLGMGLLPGLDEAALRNPTRLYCNGCEWSQTGAPPVNEIELQTFFFKCAKDFSYRGSNSVSEIPLDVVEHKLREVFPNFMWPSDFLPDTQGPSFWVPGSTSPMSAIVKPGGMLTFAAHASKSFYSWTDLLGADFAKTYTQTALYKATNEVYWDLRQFWIRRSVDAGKGFCYTPTQSEEMSRILRVNCRLSDKAAPGEASPLQLALNHVQNNQWIHAAAPFCGKPPGILHFQGKKILNTYIPNMVKPVDGPVDWKKDLPFISFLIDNLFSSDIQRDNWLAWLKLFYSSFLAEEPHPGQAVCLLGSAAKGKTLINREVVGGLMGRVVDGSPFLVKGSPFNSELFESPLWAVDDEAAGNSTQSQNFFETMLKKSVANDMALYHKKFEAAAMVQWLGRIFCTANLDHISIRLIGSLDSTSADKIHLFKCSSTPTPFPSREEIRAAIKRELPLFARWLLDWEVPDHVERDARFGFKAYHEEDLMCQVKQTSSAANFRELLSESLVDYFKNHPDATEFKGSQIMINRLLSWHPMNQEIMRQLRLDRVSRYLQDYSRNGTLKCTTENGPNYTTLYIFKRKDFLP